MGTVKNTQIEKKSRSKKGFGRMESPDTSGLRVENTL